MKTAIKALVGITAAAVLLTTPVLPGASSMQAYAATYDGQTLDYGVYWYGLGNVSQKAEPGVANPYYDPNKPTVIFSHGWQSNSTTKLWRTTFNYKQNDSTNGVDINEADAWVKAGWNIGIFQWTQFADEGAVGDAEAKIWTAAGPQGMRWRKVDGTYAAGPTVSVGQLYYDSVVSAMSGYKGNNLRLAGHSLGNQLATQLAEMLSNSVSAGTLPANMLPKRVALLDPYWTAGTKSWLSNQATGERVRNYVSDLQSKGVLFEYYKSSNLTDIGGDSNTALQKMVTFENLSPSYVSILDSAGKHNAAYNWYFWSFAAPAPLEFSVDASRVRRATGNVAASASTSDSRLQQMSGMTTSQWAQSAGQNTADPSDDQFDIKAK
jgi:hypothetical protein